MSPEDPRFFMSVNQRGEKDWVIWRKVEETLILVPGGSEELRISGNECDGGPTYHHLT
jgi:hypothetical protein